MARKKTIEELEQAAREAEKRAKELRAQAAKMTKAEQAKINAEVVKALHEWIDTFPEEKRIAWEDMPQYFRNRAEQNRQRNGQ